jgi:hypothetical protein
MISEYEIREIVTKIRNSFGTYTEFVILNEKQANKMRVGNDLLKNSNMGMKYEKGVLYILSSKMESIEKCIFCVSQQLCRRWIIPRSEASDKIFTLEISNYHNLKKDKNFKYSLYNTISTSWILFVSNLEKDMKYKFVNYALERYKTSSIKNIDNIYPRKLSSHHEIYFRINTLLCELFRGGGTSDESTRCLDDIDKKLISDLSSSIIEMSRTPSKFWEKRKIILEKYDKIYGRMRINFEEDVERKDVKNLTHLDVSVFVDKCKSNGVDDISIRNYLKKVKVLDNVELVGIDDNVRRYVS